MHERGLLRRKRLGPGRFGDAQHIAGFGWGYATVNLQTKKIKGLHENDFILAAKIDELAPQT